MDIFLKDPGKLLQKLVCIIIIAVAVYFLVPNIIEYALPFIVAYLISRLIVPAADFLEKKVKFPRKLAIILVMLFLIGVLGFLLFTIFYQGVYELQRFSHIIPAIIEGDFQLPQWITKLTDFYFALPESFREFVVMITNNFRNNLYTILEPATQAVINAATNIAKSLPNIFIFTVVLILSTYFICNDREKMRDFFTGIFPDSVIQRAMYVKKDLLKAFGGYVKAQVILMGFTFVVLLVGFSVLGVDAAVFVAFVVSIIDLIPVLGTGTVLIPWTAISLFSGRYFFAVGLLIIYAAAFLIRHLSEAKVVSSQIGLNPLVTLISVYVGLKIMGVFGMVLGPIITIIVINFVKAERRYREEKRKVGEIQTNA